jgi:hypothetical protein
VARLQAMRIPKAVWAEATGRAPRGSAAAARKG